MLTTGSWNSSRCRAPHFQVVYLYCCALCLPLYANQCPCCLCRRQALEHICHRTQVLGGALQNALVYILSC